MRRDGHISRARFDVFDVTDGDDNAFELAHAVSAKVAAELTNIPVALIKDREELGVSNFLLGEGCQELLVRRTRDDP